MKCRTTIASLIVTCLLNGIPALAGEPAYMALETGTAVEVSGQWDMSDSAFIAKEIELLPAPRRPKLRGEIQVTDSVSHQIQLFGQWINVTGKTQFLNIEDDELGFSVLTARGRVEASCMVDSTGRWVARHIRVRGVKDSDKIKGTITSTEFDGSSPDGFEIEGLRILVHEKTIIFKTLGTATNVNDGKDNAKDEVSADSGQ